MSYEYIIAVIACPFGNSHNSVESAVYAVSFVYLKVNAIVVSPFSETEI
jgi:hypothetical protein